MLSASVMKMIKKSESIREKSGNERKQKLQNRYKRSYTEEIKNSDEAAKLQGGEPVCSTEPEPAANTGSDLESSVKLDLLQKRFSHVTISDNTEGKAFVTSCFPANCVVNGGKGFTGTVRQQKWEFAEEVLFGPTACNGYKNSQLIRICAILEVTICKTLPCNDIGAASTNLHECFRSDAFRRIQIGWI
ncbi:hypothetical protein D918_04299 [Trichuris suis]|nr:hypothetical protein D918_04299 [Trichuris suis]